MNFDKHIFRSHMVGKLISPLKPLSQKAQDTLDAYSLRAGGEGRPLTTNQAKDLISLKYKKIQSETYKITDSQKKILAELVFSAKFNRRLNINSDLLTKGVTVEKQSRDMISRVCNMFFVASTERKKNDWVTGAIDIEPDNVIIDIKSAWDWTSYGKILEKSANQTYLDQLDCYMELWEKENSLLIHVLTDTPPAILERTLRSADFKEDILNIEGTVRDGSIDRVKQIVTSHLFSRQALESFCEESSVIDIKHFDDFIEVPEHERIHMIPHAYSQGRIEQRNECILLSRDYMNTVESINNFDPSLVN